MNDDQNQLQVAPASADTPFLFSAEIIEAVTTLEAKGQYTAERLKVQRPETYQAIITLRGLDWGEKRIAELLKVHHRTIAAVDDSEQESIDTVRKRLVRKLRRGASLQIDRLVEHPDLVPMHVSGLIASQLLDKAELLDGRATSREEVVHSQDIYSDWQAFVEKQLPPGAVRELSSSPIGSEAGKIPAIEDRAPAALRIPAQAGTDGQSEDRAPLQREGKADAPSYDTTRETDRGPAEDPERGQVQTSGGPRGGDAGQRGHQSGQIDRGSEKFSSNASPEP